MTNIEHLMLTMCFGLSFGWMLVSVIVIITDGIKTLKKKHRIEKEQKINEDKERIGDNL